MIRTTIIAIRAIPHSFAFAVPIIVVASIFAAVFWELRPHPFFIILALFLALALVPPYLSAALDVMLSPESPPTFKSAFSWHRHQIDFFIFTVASLIFLGVLIAALGDIARSLHETAEELQAEMDAETTQEHDKFGYGKGGSLIAIFGSRIFAGAAILIAILLWNYFFRTAIKMPAHVDGYEISNDEALSLTRHFSTQVMATSLMTNVSLSSVLAAVLPWDIAQWWMQAIMLGGTVWMFMHVNMALLVAMYWAYTESYNKRRLRSF